MKLRPGSGFVHRRDSPWILITLPDPALHRRPRNALDNASLTGNNASGGNSVNNNAMSFGVHRLVTKNNALNASGWPRPKMKIGKPRQRSDDDEDDGRPRTATLEFPKVLDVALLGKVDMTRLSKHSLMQIANLCILPTTTATGAVTDPKRFAGALLCARGVKSRRCAPARRTIRFVSSDREVSEGEDQRSHVVQPAVARRANTLHARSPARLSVSTDSDAAPSTPRRRTPSRGRRADAALGGVVRAQAPCTTCGRPDLPERLHSHPPPLPASRIATPAAPAAAATATNVPAVVMVAMSREAVKSSVRKPVAMRYRPRRRDEPHDAVVVVSASAGVPEVRRQEARTPEVPAKRAVVRTPEPARAEAATTAGREMRRGGGRTPSEGKGRGPRTLMCYICGRGFGSASFPLHEPQCMQRWQRENAMLAPHLQRAPPRKPESAMGGDDWNRQAFEASQAQLVSCANCARTFNPDRLEVHQRSCRPGAKRVSYTTTTSPAESTSEAECEASAGGEPRSLPSGPPVVHCYICGRMFGTRSIGIHEPQCLERWRAEELLLPPGRRRQQPVKPASTKIVRPSPYAHSPTPRAAPAAPAPPPSLRPPPQTATALSMASASTATPSTRRKPTMACYLCGRDFGTASINIHETSCVKRWRQENERLPAHRRRREPEKPDIVFNASGQMDFQGTMDAIWASHLGQLVPCKHCARTFNPDRVDVHERSCKGPKT